MARKTRRRISYVLPLANQVGGHRLGVNGLAVDAEHSLLYSAGRDGVICAWDLNLDLKNSTLPEYDAKLPAATPSAFRQQVQAHTHWINDIALAHSNQALVSASSDITVKLWRPAATGATPPQTIGLHTDYVKVLAVPSAHSDWVASGGLDRKINLWDLSGAGQKMTINVGDDELGSMSNKEKGSIYALAATANTIAAGGPESTVRVWDARSGKRITKLVGHTDNIRDVLVSEDGTTIMTASSDHTVKVWSTIAGRCMYTLTMHDASVWSLYSSDPRLSVFYSTDRQGLVVKTDTRNAIELDEGLSVAVAQEHESVHKVIQAGGYIWTATSRPSITRWRDINVDDAEIDVPDDYTIHRSSIAPKIRFPSPTGRTESTTSPSQPRRKIPLKHLLRLSNTAPFPTPIYPDVDRQGSIVEKTEEKEAQAESELVTLQPVRVQADYAIEGHNGLIKHALLNDRKRVLTLDTAGEVVMWDLLKCVPIKSFGKRHLDDVKDEVTTSATVANWCTVDTRTGSVAVTLEENTCFDAEMYADELELDEDIEFREDQRINLGKWVLRYLFSGLITEEIKRDQVFRTQLLSAQEEKKLQRENAPNSIQIPQTELNGWHTDERNGPQSGSTLRPGTAGTKAATPGLAIGLATPGPPQLHSPNKASAGVVPLASTAEEGVPLDKAKSNTSSSQPSVEPNTDYFNSSRAANNDPVSLSAPTKTPVTPGEGTVDEHAATTPTAESAGTKDTPTKEKGGFGKKFSMRGMSFSGMKKIKLTQTNEKEKAPIKEEKEEDVESDSRSSKTSSSRVVDDNLLGTVQKIRHGYEDSVLAQIQRQAAHENGLPVPASPAIDVPTSVTPSLPAETPVLKPPLNTTILIQEDRPEAGGVADLFEGPVGSMEAMCDIVEKVAPMWLGDVLLRNQIPQKDVVKVSFILEPAQGSGLPAIANDGNNRLNANRMLRAKKILGYVVERIEDSTERDKEGSDGVVMRPEEYLELWCLNQMVPPNMTLATIRSHLWRGGGDILLSYKPNGKKEIKPPAQPPQPAIPVSPRPADNGTEARATDAAPPPTMT